jgi:hypothetical protein
LKQVSQKKLTKIVANLFYTKNERWWLIGFYMLMANVEGLFICFYLLKYMVIFCSIFANNYNLSYKRNGYLWLSFSFDIK